LQSTIKIKGVTALIFPKDRHARHERTFRRKRGKFKVMIMFLMNKLSGGREGGGEKN
jgi:hypothetical protein